jgi:hypothetical protein
MKHKTTILTLIFLALSAAYSVQPEATRLLRDGLVLTGVLGSLKYSDSRASWFFELDSDIKEGKAIVKAGTSLELLPSTTLEKIIADFASGGTGRYRLAGRITKYKGSNYIYPSYFQAVITQNTEDRTQNSEAKVDANAPLSLPPEVRNKFNEASGGNVTIRPHSTDSNTASVGPAQSRDFMITDKTAFLVGQADGEFKFALDCLGQNLSKSSYKLLPCELLEQCESRQTSNFEPIRFNITGIVTKYKGSEYLLLLKTTRFYSNGNLGE